MLSDQAFDPTDRTATTQRDKPPSSVRRLSNQMALDAPSSNAG